MGEVGFGQCVPPLRHLKKGTSKTERFSLVGSAARASVTYMGLDAQKHWTRVESYGPKFVENIDRVIMAYGWYFRKYMIAKAGGDQNEIAYWQTRTLDFQRGVQRADPFGRWPMRFAKADREMISVMIRFMDVSFRLH